MTDQKLLSIEEVVDSFSKELPAYQRKANLDFVRMIHAHLKDGGGWFSPKLGRCFVKQGIGFVEQPLGEFLADMEEVSVH